MSRTRRLKILSVVLQSTGDISRSPVTDYWHSGNCISTEAWSTQSDECWNKSTYRNPLIDVIGSAGDEGNWRYRTGWLREAKENNFILFLPAIQGYNTWKGSVWIKTVEDLLKPKLADVKFDRRPDRKESNIWPDLSGVTVRPNQRRGDIVSLLVGDHIWWSHSLQILWTVICFSQWDANLEGCSSAVIFSYYTRQKLWLCLDVWCFQHKNWKRHVLRYEMLSIFIRTIHNME